MKVVKVVEEMDGKLVSTFAAEEWQKQYAEGVETKPDVGCLFAFKTLKDARYDFCSGNFQFWSAEANVVGKIHSAAIIVHGSWHSFWRTFKLRLRMPGAEYLLCSSITLIKRIE